MNYRRHLLQEFKLPLTAESCEKPVLFDLMKTFWTLPAENQQSVLEDKATDHILEYEVHPSSGEDSDSAHSDTAPEILSTASTVDCSERENKSTKLSAFMHHGYLGNMTKADDVNTRKGDKDQVEIVSFLKISCYWFLALANYSVRTKKSTTMTNINLAH